MPTLFCFFDGRETKEAFPFAFLRECRMLHCGKPNKHKGGYATVAFVVNLIFWSRLNVCSALVSLGLAVESDGNDPVVLILPW